MQCRYCRWWRDNHEHHSPQCILSWLCKKTLRTQFCLICYHICNGTGSFRLPKTPLLLCRSPLCKCSCNSPWGHISLHWRGSLGHIGRLLHRYFYIWMEPLGQNTLLGRHFHRRDSGCSRGRSTGQEPGLELELSKTTIKRGRGNLSNLRDNKVTFLRKRNIYG